MNFQNFNKKLKGTGKAYWLARDMHARLSIFFKRLGDRGIKKRERILFYDIMGLGYTGTDKFLQILAKNLDKNLYDVFFMYGDQLIEGSGVEDVSSRLDYLLAGKVFPIRFDYKRRQSGQPYFVEGMSPDIFDVLRDFEIDLLVTAGAGNPEYPFSSVRNIPIILINIFGQPNTQSNIKYHVCISREVAGHLSPVVEQEKIKVMYVPSEGRLPTPKNTA